MSLQIAEGKVEQNWKNEQSAIGIENRRGFFHAIAMVKTDLARPGNKAKEIPMPDYFLGVLKKNQKALAAFEKFSPSHRREYIKWITEAKLEETQQRRVAKAIQRLTGKHDS